MSDLSDVFGFPQEGGEEPDFNAIFGGGEPTEAPPILEEEPKTTDSPAANIPAEGGPTSEPQTGESTAADPEEAAKTEPPKPTEKTKAKSKTKEPEAEPDLFSAFNEPGDAPEPPAQKTELAPAGAGQVSLFDKPAIFSYGAAKEPIEDASITFEDLRIRKSEDFPELESGKTVSWRVKYGAVTKSVTDPKTDTVAKLKEEIERSKAFLDGLKKAKNDKDRNPNCLVSPVVTAKSKGIAAYTGVFPTVEAARASDKVICILPAKDGKIYEMRKSEMGEFIAPKHKVVDFAEVRAGFTPALPLIPRELMGQIISFFRSLMDGTQEYEAMVFLYWDRQEEEFVVYVPKQSASRASIHANLVDNTLPEDRYLHYADIHSHNSMAAKFSAVDDADEKTTRLYIVIGRLERFYPDIAARVSCGGTYLPINPNLVMEDINEEFPLEWLHRVLRVEGMTKQQKEITEAVWRDLPPYMEELGL